MSNPNNVKTNISNEKNGKNFHFRKDKDRCVYKLLKSTELRFHLKKFDIVQNENSLKALYTLSAKIENIPFKLIMYGGLSLYVFYSNA